jgi:hypothetical protein
MGDTSISHFVFLIYFTLTATDPFLTKNIGFSLKTNIIARKQETSKMPIYDEPDFATYNEYWSWYVVLSNKVLNDEATEDERTFLRNTFASDCKTCGRTYVWNTQLTNTHQDNGWRRHNLKHHPFKTQVPYECKPCGYTTTNGGRWRAHLETKKHKSHVENG